MGKEEYQTYKSKKILGKLYCLIKDDYDKGVEEASSDLTFDPKNVPYDSTLEFLGSKDFVSNAWKHKCSYDRQLNSLLGQYKVSREGKKRLLLATYGPCPRTIAKREGTFKRSSNMLTVPLGKSSGKFLTNWGLILIIMLCMRRRHQHGTRLLTILDG